MEKKIGLIGGPNYRALQDYYSGIGLAVRSRVGGYTSPAIFAYAMPCAQVQQWIEDREWGNISCELTALAVSLEKSGASCIGITSNTLHGALEEVERYCGLPIIHIGDAVASECSRLGLQTVGLLGSACLNVPGGMRDYLRHCGLNIITPDSPRYQRIDNIINTCRRGEFVFSCRPELRSIICSMMDKGADGIAVCSTELSELLVGCDIFINNQKILCIHSMNAHIESLADFCLGGS